MFRIVIHTDYRCVIFNKAVRLKNIGRALENRFSSTNSTELFVQENNAAINVGSTSEFILMHKYT